MNFKALVGMLLIATALTALVQRAEADHHLCSYSDPNRHKCVWILYGKNCAHCELFKMRKFKGRNRQGTAEIRCITEAARQWRVAVRKYGSRWTGDFWCVAKPPGPKFSRLDLDW